VSDLGDVLVELDRRHRELVALALAGRPAAELLGGDGVQQLLSPGQVSGLLGVSVRTLRRWGSSGRFPAPLRLGRLPRWTAAQVAEYLRKCIRQSAGAVIPERGGPVGVSPCDAGPGGVPPGAESPSLSSAE